MSRPAWLPAEPDPDELALFREDEVPRLVDPGPREGSIEARFVAFHDANPWVYDALRTLALDLVRRGRTRIGIKMLFEVVRWQHARATVSEDGVKLNNDLSSRYARVLADREPELAEAFETRRLRAD